MRLALIGLGRMGLALLQRAGDCGLEAAGYDLLDSVRSDARRRSLLVFDQLDVLKDWSGSNALVVMLVPAGEAVDQTIELLQPLAGPIYADFGNSNYLDSRRRAAHLGAQGASYLDVGMSGGIDGARHGPCLTVGGDRATFLRAEPLLNRLAAKGGLLYAGPSGCGHVVKTIHNGIEYGMLQAIGEGLQALATFAEGEGIELDLSRVAEVWQHGSIIESRLMADAVIALKSGAHHQASGSIGGGQTGQWALDIARQLKLRMPALEAALEAREESRKHPDLSGKIIAAIRNQFGGHNLLGQ